MSRARTGALLREALGVLLARPWAFLCVAIVFVVPIELAVLGVGLEQLTRHYDRSPDWPQTAIPAIVDYFLLTPLVTAGCIHLLVERPAGARRAIQRALDMFAPLFLALLIVGAGVLLGALAFLLPGIYLFIRWYFVPQAVVLEGKRGAASLRASGDVVEGAWWRTFGTVALANLLALLPSLLIALPFQSLADSANRQVFALAGGIIADVIATPFVAVVGTLLYFDLRARAV